MKLATSTYVKIGLILLLCALICGWLGGCGRYSYWADRGITLFPAGGLFGCAATEMVADTVEEIVDGSLSGLSEIPDVPSAPSAPSAPTAPPSPGTIDAWGLGSFTVEPALVNAIELNWLAGEVKVRVVPETEATVITATETIDGRVPELQWDLDGGVLSINYMDSRSGLSSCSSGWRGSKKLELVLPESILLTGFNLSAVSGRYNIEGYKPAASGTLCDSMNLEIASGEVRIENFDVNWLNLELASGTFDFDGEVSERISIDQASGQAKLKCGTPGAIATSLASGSLEFELGPSAVLKETVSKTSGDYTNNLSPVNEGGSPAECVFDLDMLSGSCVVRGAR